MIKETHVLREYPDTPKGYAQMHPPTEKEEWDKVHEICDANKTQYLKHFVSSAWIEDPEAEPYVPECNQRLSIPMGTDQFLITIYMQ
jgi:hypothetical protein